MFEQWSSSALNIGVIIFVVIVAVGVIGGLMWAYFQWKKYSEFRCVIWERNGFGQLVQRPDRAGIFVDSKTNNKRFFMKRANVGLSPDNVPYIPTQDGKKLVYLYRDGLKNFSYIRPSFDGGLKVTVGEEDVNWAINAYERQKKLFSGNKWEIYLPYIALALVSIVILVIFIYFFKDFKVLAETATALREAAAIIAQTYNQSSVLH